MKKKFPVVYEKCPCVVEAYRNYVRELLNDYEKTQKGTKLKIVKRFLKISPSLKKRYFGKLNYCKICQEPSAKDICNRCTLLKRLNLYKSK